jgi:methylated-DNA-protein-cysteine methyltransferase-like protein
MSASGTRRIHDVIRRIPKGCVTTYGAVGRAARVGARQVGYALHRLPDGTPLPWHRVINASGGISLRGASAITQRLRLEREGVRFTARGAVSLARYGWLLGVALLLAVRPAPAQQAAARFTAAQFGQLHWLVGFWRGSGGNYPAFFEDYRLADDSTLTMHAFSDSLMVRCTGSATIQLRGGQVLYQGGSNVWQAATLSATAVRFEPASPGNDGFTWQRVSATRWTATLGPAGRPTVYQMQKLRP